MQIDPSAVQWDAAPPVDPDKVQWEQPVQKSPDMAPLKQFFTDNLKKPVAGKEGPQQARTFADYLDAGYQMSVSGLLKRGKMPDKLLPQDAPLWADIVSALGGVAGDLPAMLPGAWAGGEAGAVGGAAAGAAIGSAIPLAGTVAGAATGATAGAVVGGGAGAFALPAYIRSILVQQYQNGDVKSAKDFWSRQAVAFIESAKQAEVGAATAGVGGVVVGAIAKPILSTAAKLASEATTMVTMGKAVEGQLPEPKDFVTAAVLVAGMHLAVGGAGAAKEQITRLTQKIGDVYAKTGEMPADLVAEAQANPVVRQELASTNIDVPTAYADKIDPVQAVKTKPVAVPEAMREQLPVGGEPTDVEIAPALESNANVPLTELASNVAAAKTGAERNAALLVYLDRYVAEQRKSDPIDIYERANVDPSVRAARYIDRGKDGMPETVRSALQKLDAMDGETGESLNALTDSFRTSHLLNLEQSVEYQPHGHVAESFAEPQPSPAAPTTEPTSGSGDGKDLAAIKARIAFEPSPKTGITFDKLYTDTIDALHPIKQLRDMLAGKEPVATKDDPYELARLTRGSAGRADQFLEHSPFKFDTLENTGQSLSKVLEPVRGEIDDFRAYAVARRATELSGRGIETGVPMDAAKAVVAGGKRFEKAFTQLQDYQRTTLEYLRDSGLISADGFAKMQEANKDYVPFYRLMVDEPGGPGNAGKGLSVRSPIKRIKGSERQIVDPIESIVKNTYLYVRLAENNRAVTALQALAEKYGDAGKELMERVATVNRPVNVSEPEVARFMKEQGIEGDTAAFNIFRPAQHNLAKDEIALYRDGKKEVYRVAPEVATAVRALDQESISLLVKMAAAPSRLLRAGTTLSPDFTARNFFRDQLFAFGLNKTGFVPIYDSLRGLGSVLKKDDDYQNWLKSGGANAAMVAIDRHYVERNVLKIAKETGLMSHAWNVIKSPIEVLKITSELIENATRVGAFKRNMGSDKSAESILSSGYASREQTLDFQRMGAKTRALNMIVAFWNASVQGLDKTARAFQERPVSTSLKLAGSITLPSVLLWWANHDDPRYKDVPDWQKDLFWIVMTKDHIYRIPKPMELGVLFGSLPERTLDAYYSDKPNAFNNLSSDFMGALTPSYLPTFAVPIIEQFSNRSTFTGNPIVPASLEGILPEYQYTDYTTESGKMLGRLVATVPGMKDNQLASPAVIENYIRAWSGSLGMYALKLADQALIKTGAVPDPVKPTATLADIPVIKAFVVRYPSASAQSIQDFYTRYDEVKKRIDTIHHLAKGGDFTAAMKELQLAQESDLMLNLTGIKTALSTQSRFIQLTNQNQQLKPEEKRQIIDGSYYMMIRMTQQGNELIAQMKNAEKVVETRFNGGSRAGAIGP